jgi:hypothetical protein
LGSLVKENNMKPSDITFSVNSYDRDGDIIDKGIFLHFGDTMVRVADNLADFKSITFHMEKIVKEIEENYG